jgi:prepilin peptidase CpaA
MNRDSILLCVALVLAVLAAALDLQQRRIPNWLTYPGILAGFGLRAVFFGWKGLLSALVGCLLAGGIMLIFYAVQAMGAGDVKLLAAIGALTGPHQAIGVLLATAIFGGILGIVYAISKGRMISTLKNVGSVLRFHAVSGMQSHPEVNLDNPEALRMPYGLAIALGTLYMFTSIWWR